MYAPTFRDYMSADDMAAERIDFFDVERASRDLGPGYTLLVRGHAFNARAGGRHEGGGHVIDVTGHPDINDLILASDAAVLDYSSLRFDYALDRQADDLPGPRPREVRRGARRRDPVRADGSRAARHHDPRGGRPGSATSTVSRGVPRPSASTFRRSYTDLDDGHASARLVDAVFVPRGDA